MRTLTWTNIIPDDTEANAAERFNAPKHKSNVGSDVSMSQADLEKQEEEDMEAIEIALASIQMRDNLRMNGCSEKAIKRKLKLLEKRHKAEDMRETLKAYRALKGDHKSNAGKAAETDSGSGPDDDDPDFDEQEEEDMKDIEIALTCAEMLKYMASAGHSKKAINRKIKLFERNMHLK